MVHLFWTCYFIREPCNVQKWLVILHFNYTIYVQISHCATLAVEGIWWSSKAQRRSVPSRSLVLSATTQLTGRSWGTCSSFLRKATIRKEMEEDGINLLVQKVNVLSTYRRIWVPAVWCNVLQVFSCFSRKTVQIQEHSFSDSAACRSRPRRVLVVLSPRNCQQGAILRS